MTIISLGLLGFKLSSLPKLSRRARLKLAHRRVEVRETELLFMRCLSLVESDNGNDHRAAAIDLQAGKTARPAAPCASHCYPAIRCVRV